MLELNGATCAGRQKFLQLPVSFSLLVVLSAKLEGQHRKIILNDNFDFLL